MPVLTTLGSAFKLAPPFDDICRSAGIAKGRIIDREDSPIDMLLGRSSARPKAATCWAMSESG